MAVDNERPCNEKQLPQWLTSIMFPAVNNMGHLGLPGSLDRSQNYLLGVRGCLAIMSFLWAFLQTFTPAAVAHSSNVKGPSYQITLRKSLSILFWNDSLIYSSIIFLSARMICLPFLLDSNKNTLASSVFRRGPRLWFPVVTALIICYVVFSKTLGTQYLSEFADQTENLSMHSDLYVLPNSLANFNSIFDVFWITSNISYQAANWAFPTQTLWIVSVIFQQSYTVYTTMVIIPYTRKNWRIWVAPFFIITAWWVYSWALFSVAGLLLADLVVNMDFRKTCQANLAWTYSVAGLCLVSGFTMQFLWVTARPDLYTAEIDYHTGIYNTGGIYTWNDTTAPQLRADDFLVIVGFFILLESTNILQNVFCQPALVYIGRRSYSYFLLQSIIIYTLGIKIVQNMTSNNMEAYPYATGIAFIACILVTAAAGETFYWVMDVPSQKFARLVFAWICD